MTATYTTPQAALDAWRAVLTPVDAERVDLAAAAGRVLAKAVRTDRPSPAADVSSMDGYALRMADVGAATLAVAGEAAAGQPPIELPVGCVARVFTGAVVPRGAELVLQREWVQEAADRITLTATARAGARPGLNIRRQGENLAAGEQVVDRGRLITAPVVAALAACGVAQPSVLRRVRASVLVTGDEVLDVASRPEPWQLRDSNGPSLSALLDALPWVQRRAAERVPDQPEALRRSVAAALADSDAVLVTGGVSAGDRDYVPAVLADLGVRVLFHRLPQRPGRPILAGVGPAGQLVAGLPGNPVSTLVTARRLVRPALATRAGLAWSPGDSGADAVLHVDPPDGATLDLWWHRLVTRRGADRAALVAGRGSGDVVSVARSDGFVEIPPGQAGPGPWPFFAW